MPTPSIADHTSANTTLEPLDLVLACAICQKPLKYAYDTCKAQDGSPKRHDANTIKMWLTSCAHLTCSEHLHHGGAPFHPHGKLPEAACPFCVQHYGDKQARCLYWIKGLGPGERDANIPQQWLTMPPIPLDGDDPGIEALRFQVLSLVRFGTSAAGKIRALEEEKRDLKTSLEQSVQQHAALAEQIRLLSADRQAWEAQRSEFDRWKAQEPEIKQYLARFTGLAQENLMLRHYISDCGIAVPSQQYLHEQQRHCHEATTGPQTDHRHGHHRIQPSAQVYSEAPQTSSSRKRRRSSRTGYAEPLHQNYAFNEQLPRIEHLSHVYEQRRETPRLMVARGEFQDVFAHNAQARTGTLMQSHGSAIARGDSVMRYSPRKTNDTGITNIRLHPELSPQKKYSHAFAQAYHSPTKYQMQPSMPPPRSIRSHSPRKAATLHTLSPRKASAIHQPSADLVASPHFSRQSLPRPNQSPRERLSTHLLPLHDTTSPRRPSLNALSFISAPHDEATHRPLLPTHHEQQPRSYRTAQGLFTRPDIRGAGQGASRRGQPDAALSVIAGAKTAAGLGRGIYG